MENDSTEGNDTLPEVEPVARKVLPPPVHDASYRIRVEQPCWFLGQPPCSAADAAATTAGTAATTEAAQDAKERVLARVQWLCFTRRHADALAEARALLAAGAVAGCALSRSERAELTEICASCTAHLQPPPPSGPSSGPSS